MGDKGNTIDAPAALWLSKQPEPRAYITDGQFFGRDENGGSPRTDRIRSGVGAIMRYGRLTQYGTVKKFIAAHKRPGAR